MRKSSILFILIFGITNLSFLNSTKDRRFKEYLIFGNDPMLTSKQDTLDCIKYMLKRKGDTRINMIWVDTKKTDTILNPMSSSSSRLEKITHQIAALYLISSLHYGTYDFARRVQLYYYSPDSIYEGPTKFIRNLEIIGCGNCLLKSFQHFDGVDCHKIVDKGHLREIFKNYEKWFELVETYGLDSVRKMREYPLKGSQYIWAGEEEYLNKIEAVHNTR